MTQVLDRDAEDSAAADVLLASQWNQRSAAQFLDVPERRLLVAVLADAVRVLMGRDQKQRAHVVRWIKGHDARVAFHHLCVNLELDPEATAAMLLRAAAVRGQAGRHIPTRRVACAGRRSGTVGRRRNVAA